MCLAHVQFFTDDFTYPLVCVPLLVVGWAPSAQTLKRMVDVRGEAVTGIHFKPVAQLIPNTI